MFGLMNKRLNRYVPTVPTRYPWCRLFGDILGVFENDKKYPPSCGNAQTWKKIAFFVFYEYHVEDDEPVFIKMPTDQSTFGKRPRGRLWLLSGYQLDFWGS